MTTFYVAYIAIHTTPQDRVLPYYNVGSFNAFLPCNLDGGPGSIAQIIDVINEIQEFSNTFINIQEGENHD